MPDEPETVGRAVAEIDSGAIRTNCAMLKRRLRRGAERTRATFRPDRADGDYVPCASVVEFDGPAVDTTSGQRNWLRVKRAGQLVRRGIPA